MLFVLAILCVLSLSQLAAGVMISRGIVYRSANISQDGQTLLLGALFPIHMAGESQPPCGTVRRSAVQTVEAMVLAIRTINEDPDLLPNVTLAFDIRDTCLTVNYALQQSADYIQSNGACDADQASLDVSAVVGPFQSTISEANANLYGLFQIPQISYGSTAAVLSDKNRYNFFFRTIPSDLFQARALVDIVIRFGWRHIILLYSNDIYGEGGRDEFRMELSRRGTGEHCIADVIELSDNPPNYGKAVNSMNQDWVRNASVVLLFGHMENAVGMLRTIRDRVREDPDFPLQNLTWLASDSWGDNLPVEYRPLARGMLSTVPLSTPVQAFDSYFTSLTPLNNAENPWFAEYWESVFNCNLGLSPALPDCDIDGQLMTSNYSQFSLVPLVFDAVNIFAQSVQNLIDAKCPNGNICSDILDGGAINGTLLRGSLLNVSDSTTSVKFDENGDVAGNYSVLDLQTTANNEYVFVEVGRWDTENGLSIREGDIDWVTGSEVPQSRCSVECGNGEIRKPAPNQPACCFTCVACLDDEIVVGRSSCEHCELGESPNLNQTACINNTITYLFWSNPWSIVLILLTSFGLLATLTVIIVFLINIKHEFIKASSRELSAVLLCGILLCYGVTYFYIAKPSATICGFRRFFLGFCFAVTYSALLVKTNRIHRIFNRNPNSSAKQLRFVSPLSQVIITAMFVAVQVLINVVWLAVEPPATLIIPGDNSNELTCAFSPQTGLAISLTYSFVLLILSTYFAFLTRKVPANFNEAKFINVTVYSILIIWLAFVPTYFATAELGAIFQTVSVIFGVLLSATTTLCCLFVSKVFLLFRKKKKEESTAHSNHISLNTGTQSGKKDITLSFQSGKKDNTQSFQSGKKDTVV